MGLVVAFITIGVVLLIGVVLVIREAGRLAKEPPAPTFDMDEAYDWVVDELPDVVAATLTPDDVRRILDFQLEYFRRRGVAGNGSGPSPPGEVVITGSETVAYILRRAADTGEPYLPEQVHAVVETQMRYLRAIGAAGEAGDPPLGAAD